MKKSILLLATIFNLFGFVYYTETPNPDPKPKGKKLLNSTFRLIVTDTCHLPTCWKISDPDIQQLNNTAQRISNKLGSLTITGDTCHLPTCWKFSKPDFEQLNNTLQKICNKTGKGGTDTSAWRKGGNLVSGLTKFGTLNNNGISFVTANNERLQLTNNARAVWKVPFYDASSVLVMNLNNRFLADSAARKVVSWYNGNFTLSNTFGANPKFVYQEGNQAENKVLTSDANGVGTWQSLPVQTPTLTATRIGFGNASNNLTGSSNLTFNNSNLKYKLGSASQWNGISGLEPIFSFRKDTAAQAYLTFENQNTNGFAALTVLGEPDVSPVTNGRYAQIGLTNATYTAVLPAYRSQMYIQNGGDNSNGLRIYSDNNKIQLGTVRTQTVVSGTTYNIWNPDLVVRAASTDTTSNLPNGGFIGLNTEFPSCRLHVHSGGVRFDSYGNNTNSTICYFDKAGNLQYNSALQWDSTNGFALSIAKNGGIASSIFNPTNSASAYTDLFLGESSTHGTQIFCPSRSYTGTGALSGGSVAIYNTDANVNLVAANASGSIGFYTGGGGTAQLRASINANGKFITKAATTTTAGLNLPSGTQPTSGAAGDIYFNGTHFYGFNGSAWVQLDN